MTPEAPPNPPRKAFWKLWTLASACVLAITLAVLFLKAPSPEPVSVRFVGSTDDNGQRILHFQGTNGLSRRITYFAYAFTRQKNGPPSGIGMIVASPGGTPLVVSTTSRISPVIWNVLPKETFTFSIVAPPEETDWQVVWNFSKPDDVLTRWEKARRGCQRFLIKHHMHTLARPFADPDNRHYLSPSELKE